MEQPDFSNVSCAGFLEDLVKELIEKNPVGIAVQAKLPDGKILQGDWEVSPWDKALFAHQLQCDAIFAEIEANGDWLRSIVDDDEELTDEEEEQEDE